MDNNKLLPFAVMPELSFGNAEFADVDAHLTAICRMHQFRQTSPGITVHLHVAFKFLNRAIDKFTTQADTQPPLQDYP